MINPDQIVTLLRKFFEGQPPFAEASELVGHSSSGQPDVFLRWFTALTAADREAICGALIDCTLSGAELDGFLPQAGFLLVELAVKQPASFSRDSIEALASYMRRGEVASNWLRDQDSESDHLKDYRSRWRFALCLWNALYALKCPAAMEMFRVFTSRASDPEFVRSLQIAKKVRDDQFERSPHWHERL